MRTLAEYWGETGRNCYLRGGEHWKGLRDKDEENAFWKHTWAKHRGEIDPEMFEMKLEGSFKKPLSRQIREGVELEMSVATMVMNSKSEWNHSRIPRIVIETGEELKNDNESGIGSNRERSGKSEAEIREKRRTFTVRKFNAEKRTNLVVENLRPSKKKKQEEENGEIRIVKDKTNREEIKEAEEKIKRRNREKQARQVKGKNTNKGGDEKVLEEKEKARKEYWRNVFQAMAQRNREKYGENLVIGADAHVERMRKSRGETKNEGGGNPTKEEPIKPAPKGRLGTSKTTIGG